MRPKLSMKKTTERTIQNQPEKNNSVPDIVIITGLSGSGMSAATNAFEDLGYFCVDNLPITMLPTFARLVTAAGEEKGIERAALVIDIRERTFLADFGKQLDALRAAGLIVHVLFLEASDDVLQHRFSETRRPHPATGQTLLQSIAAERAAMARLRSLADQIIDTSDHTVHSLRSLLLARFSPDLKGGAMRVQVLSFGHKYGNPGALELLFDVRHLPNPHFIPELRKLSGHDQRVVKYLKAQPDVEETLRRFYDLLDYLLPQYKREGKSYVTVGIGCTGGRHRSVMIANALGRKLRRAGFDAHVVHRDVRKSNRPR
jgi:UPF0042 nucleotide-binding protein